MTRASNLRAVHAVGKGVSAGVARVHSTGQVSRIVAAARGAAWMMTMAMAPLFAAPVPLVAGRVVAEVEAQPAIVCVAVVTAIPTR